RVASAVGTLSPQRPRWGAPGWVRIWLGVGFRRCLGLFCGIALVPLIASAQPLPQTVIGAAPGILDSLELVAVTAREPSARRSAVVRISNFGRFTTTGEPSGGLLFPGVVARLARVYELAAPGLQSDILYMMVGQ